MALDTISLSLLDDTEIPLPEMPTSVIWVLHISPLVAVVNFTYTRIMELSGKSQRKIREFFSMKCCER